VPPRLPAVRAGLLGGDRRVDLVGDHSVLDRGEQVVGFAQMQADSVGGQGFAVQAEHVAHHGRGVGGVVGLQDDLHAPIGCGEPSEGAVEGAAVEALQTEQRQQATT